MADRPILVIALTKANPDTPVPGFGHRCCVFWLAALGLWRQMRAMICPRAIRAVWPCSWACPFRGTPTRPRRGRTRFADIARLINDFLDALGMADVTLVGNDTGGALCQFLKTPTTPGSVGSYSPTATPSISSRRRRSASSSKPAGTRVWFGS